MSTIEKNNPSQCGILLGVNDFKELPTGPLRTYYDSESYYYYIWHINDDRPRLQQLHMYFGIWFYMLHTTSYGAIWGYIAHNLWI